MAEDEVVPLESRGRTDIRDPRRDIAGLEPAAGSVNLPGSKDDGSSDAPASAEELLIGYIERELRASVNGGATTSRDDRVVASALVDRVVEIANGSPPEQATRLRTALAERAYAVEIDADGEPAYRHPLGPTLDAELSSRDGHRERNETDREVQSARDLELLERGREREAQRAGAHRREHGNRIEAPDGAGNEQAERQLDEFIELVADQSGVGAPANATGVFARLRGLIGRETLPRAGSEQRAALENDDLVPELLRRRYGVHVSEDQKKIDLFEAGGKTPAISMDARSISTRQNEGAVVADIALLARDRGWQSLKVAGTPEFKDAMWLEATKLGLSLDHSPSPAAHAALDRWERERPANRVELARAHGSESANGPQREDLGALFSSKTPEERLADPRLRNAQLELMVGLRTAEKELGRRTVEIPDVARAMAAVVSQQLASGKVFEAPFARPEMKRPSPREIVNPRIEADRIPPPRP